MIQYPRLMPLRIPARWAVTYNSFFDVDPIIDEASPEGRYKNMHYFTEDLMQIVKSDMHDGWPAIPKDHLLIDLGYFPEGCKRGEYVLTLAFTGKERGWEDIVCFKSDNRYEIRDKIEEWLEKSRTIETAEDARRIHPK